MLIRYMCKQVMENYPLDGWLLKVLLTETIHYTQMCKSLNINFKPATVL